MRILHRIAMKILPYKWLVGWYRWTLGDDFIGTFYRYPIFKSKHLVGEDD